MSDSHSSPTGDEAIGQAEHAARTASAARLFDLRRIIGGLFVVYGVILVVAGVVDGDEASEKAAGIDINIWTGIGMLLLGLFFLAWLRLSPPEPPPPRRASDDDGGRARRPGH